MLKNQKGFGALEIIIVIVVIAAVGGLGWWIWQAQQNKTTVDNNSQNYVDTTVLFTDACTVVSKADVESVFGTPFGDWQQEPTGTTSAGLPSYNCTIQQANDGSVAGLNDAINLTVQVENYGSESAARDSLLATRNSAEFGDKVYFEETPVNSVGDEAFFFQGQSEIALKTEEFLYARKGSQVFHFIAVRLSGIDHEAAQVQLTQLAQIALN